VSLELWDWWENRLSDHQRSQLLVEADVVLPPDLALELWRSSGRLRIVEPETWTVDADPLRWRLAGDAADFVHQRRYEQTHPNDR
jgi:hypothetical protein